MEMEEGGWETARKSDNRKRLREERRRNYTSSPWFFLAGTRICEEKIGAEKWSNLIFKYILT